MTNASSTAKAKSSPNDLGTKPVGDLLVQYSLPAIIAALVTSLYNIIDSIFIGRGVGAMAISGLAITFPLMNLVVAFCVLIAAGGATISSIFLGQKNVERATDVVNNVLILCLIHSLVVGGLTLLFLDPILLFFGATAETLPYAREFMVVILLGTPVSYVFIGLNNLMRATGYPRKAMISALLSVLANVILAPVFIFFLGWGIAGAATATICSQGVGLVWVLSHFLNKNSFVHFRKRERWLDWHNVRRIYAIGLSPFLMNCCACVVVIFINRALLQQAGDMGNMAVGAFGIINRTAMFFVMIVLGVSQGMQPILGYNFGAGNAGRVFQTLKRGLWIGGIIGTVGFVLAECIPDTMAGMFTTDATMISLARSGYRIALMSFTFVGIQVVITNYFQSIGMPKLSIFLSLTRQLIFLLPLLLFLPGMFGVEGVWLSLGVSDFVAFLLAVTTLLVLRKKVTREINRNTPAHA